MKTINHVQLLGPVRKAPVLVKVGGKDKISFAIPTCDYDSSGKEYTDWHNCYAWGKRAEILGKYLRAGDEILLTGKMKKRSWESDGRTNTVCEIEVIDFKIFYTNKPVDFPEEVSSDLPF